MKNITLSKEFWWIVALLTGVSTYVALFTFTLLGGWTPFDSFLVGGLGRIVFWPAFVMFDLSSSFWLTPFGTVLEWIWLLAAGPGLFITVWTWVFFAVIRLFKGKTRIAQQTPDRHKLDVLLTMMNGKMKKKIAVCVLVLWCFAVVFSGAVFIWASPDLLVYVQTLPDVQYLPKVLSGYWVVPLLVILGSIAARRIRRVVVKTLVCLIAFSVACCPSYQVMMALRASSQAEAVGRMRLASVMLLYSLGLALFFFVVLVIQIKKQDTKVSEATSEPAPSADSSSPQG